MQVCKYAGRYVLINGLKIYPYVGLSSKIPYPFDSKSCECGTGGRKRNLTVVLLSGIGRFLAVWLCGGGGDVQLW